VRRGTSMRMVQRGRFIKVTRRENVGAIDIILNGTRMEEVDCFR
jgi:hypothetical protein